MELGVTGLEDRKWILNIGRATYRARSDHAKAQEQEQKRGVICHMQPHTLPPTLHCKGVKEFA